MEMSGNMLKIESITSKIKIEEKKGSDDNVSYILSPLFRGYGNTIGNSLRRALLSSIPGCAIKGMKINNVMNEFSVVEGIKENVVDIMLNIKSIVLKTSSYGEKRLTINAKGPKIVKASDIKCDPTVEVVNKDQVIATLSDNSELNIELIADTGEGFVMSEEIDSSSWPAGFLPIDAIYSPIKRVSYEVEDTMVGRSTNYDKLTLKIETNGSVKAQDALSYAVELLIDHFNAIKNIGNSMEHLKPSKEASKSENNKSEISSPDIRIEDLDLSVRSYNCLKKENILYLKDLAKMDLKDLSHIKNFGKNSLNEIVDKLKTYGIEIE
jgi:DNA-directed RNA polymerase subunit alpha